MTALVEEAVSIGDLVRIFTFQQGQANMLEFTLPDDSGLVGTRVGDVDWSPDTVLVAVIREERPFAPSVDDVLEAHDELLILAAPEFEADLKKLLSPGAGSASRAARQPGD